MGKTNNNIRQWWKEKIILDVKEKGQKLDMGDVEEFIRYLNSPN